MPTYEYQCEACGHAFEAFQPMSADPIKKCPNCKKNKVKRLISAGAGLIFKGSGFYITDYRDQAYTDKAKADVAPGSGTDTKSGTDAKPAETKAGGDAKPAAEAKSTGDSKSSGGSSSNSSSSPSSGSSAPATPTPKSSSKKPSSGKKGG